MRALSVVPLFLALLASGSQSKAPSPLRRVWRLVSFESRDATGRVTQPMGSRPVGQLLYDESGNMSVHLMRPERTRFASGDRLKGTDQEVRGAFEGYQDTHTHQRLELPNDGCRGRGRPLRDGASSCARLTRWLPPSSGRPRTSTPLRCDASLRPGLGNDGL